MSVDTWSWQAQGFYERHGFTVFGVVEDFPLQHRRLFQKKRLDGEDGLEPGHARHGQDVVRRTSRR